MSVTDTKEFIRMEIAADKLGVDQVKLVRMMQDKKNDGPFRVTG